MRISNQTPTYQPTARAQRTSSGTGSFGKQLDIAASRRGADQLEFGTAGVAWQAAGTMEPSPYLKLLHSYEAWKAQQPPQDLPDSWGPTEENLAYLKEHYTGDLSWEERIDALETMKKMGIIDQEQSNAALGSEMVEIQLVERPDGSLVPEKESESMWNGLVEREIERYNAYLSGGWDAYFQDRPVGTFQTADDLFAWLDKLLESDA
ncbi:MAG: hypothetical protein K2O45_00005 [Oscillospiraceae bacterium]|nr:hypothetical protein [Oscillospiraceae bacterium]